MPFGLNNTPATFQSLMNDIFRPLQRRHALVFFDDILVYSKTWEAHISHLRQVFQLLQTHSLVVNPKKCLLGRNEVEYLGHIVSAASVHMDPSKISAVVRWPTPTSLKGVRGFLGLTGYYRRFIRNYGKIVAPLTALLKKSEHTTTKKGVGMACRGEQGVSRAQVGIDFGPHPPDFSKEFVIECDASGRGLGQFLCRRSSQLPSLASPFRRDG